MRNDGDGDAAFKACIIVALSVNASGYSATATAASTTAATTTTAAATATCGAGDVGTGRRRDFDREGREGLCTHIKSPPFRLNSQTSQIWIAYLYAD